MRAIEKWSTDAVLCCRAVRMKHILIQRSA